MRSGNPIPPHPFVASFRLSLLVLCVLCDSVVNLTAQNFKTVAPGVEYAEVTREIDKTPVRMNLLRLDLTKVRLDVVHANDAAVGTEAVSSMAKRHGAFAAINGGFFRDDKSAWAGDSAGALQIDRRIFSESVNGRVALILDNKPNACEECDYTADLTLTWIDHLNTIKTVTVGKQVIEMDGVNRERSNNELVIYTHDFGPSTLTDNAGWEVVISKNKISTVVSGIGNQQIPSNGFVLSGTGARMAAIISKLKIGKKVRFNSEFYVDVATADGKNSFKSYRPGEDVVAGVPQLIKNGKIDITWEQEKTNLKFVETLHPRTAVAQLRGSGFLMITVDGRSESSGGISLNDLADYLLSLGAINAMNLDGGGSSTMFLDGKVVNHPSDKEGERKVSDAILVTLRKPLKNR